MFESPLPFGIDDLDPKVLIHRGPPKQIRCFVKGCSTLLEPARRQGGPVCSRHDIRCHRSRTFSYDRPERNAIVDRAIFARQIVGNPHKVESGRLANEKSEDTLTWNVFRAFQKAGCLGKLARVVATPQNMVAGLRDNHQFVLLLHSGLRNASQRQAQA